MVPPVSTLTGYSVLVAFHVIFVVAMIAGMYLYKLIEVLRLRQADAKNKSTASRLVASASPVRRSHDDY